MENQEKSQGSDAQYYEKLHQRLCEIRDSDMTPRKKIAHLISQVLDGDIDNTSSVFNDAFQKMSLMDNVRLQRMFNALSMIVESHIYYQNRMDANQLGQALSELCFDIDYNPTAYCHTSFFGVYEEVDENAEDELTVDVPMVSLPAELQQMHFGQVILQIMDARRFFATFSYRNSPNRLGYEILADLEKRVLDNAEDYTFPSWEMIDYKLDGDAMFEFSHFEVDTTEPDNTFRTLYVVYRYDTTRS